MNARHCEHWELSRTACRGGRQARKSAEEPRPQPVRGKWRAQGCRGQPEHGIRPRKSAEGSATPAVKNLSQNTQLTYVNFVSILPRALPRASPGWETDALPLDVGDAMFGSKTILIADGSTYAALDLAAAVEASGGRVAGPVQTLAEALAIIGSRSIAGAIVDCELADAAALVLRLSDSGVPLIAQTSVPLPPELLELDGRLPVVMRPVNADTVVATLAVEIVKAEERDLGLEKVSPATPRATNLPPVALRAEEGDCPMPRELIDTGTDKRFVRRDQEGQFKESDDVGRSLASDQKRDSKAKTKRGEGDRGDR